MGPQLKLFLLVLVYAFIIRKHVVFALDKSSDSEYDVIKFKVPHTIWKHALRPTPPILKSPVTITLPVHVQGDDENEVEDDEEEQVLEDVSVDSTLVNNDQVETPVQDPVVPPEQDPVVNTPAPVQQDEVLEDVPGQVTRFPCACVDGQCGCCTGTIMERFRMKACGNMTFVPEDFIFDVRLSVNNNTVIRRRVSASDPPPICFNPRRAPFVRICAEISNISVKNRNARACLDINADIGGFQIYSASFRCFSFGSSGLQTGLKPKPPSSGPKPVSLFGNGGEEEGGFIENAAQTVLGGGDGLFGGGQGLLGGDGGGLLGGGNGGGLFGGDGGGIFGGGGDGGGFFGGGGDGGGIFGGGGDGIFGGGGGDNGPFEGIGDAIGDFL